MNKASLKRAAPLILSTLSAIGVIATTASAIKATPKAVQLLAEKEHTYAEKAKVLIPVYLPTFLFGLATIICIFGSGVMSKQNQASLVGAYTLLDQSFKNYKKGAVSAFGEDADARIQEEIVKESVYERTDGVYQVDDDSSERILFYDYIGQRYFEASMARVIYAQYAINRRLMLEGSAMLNEFYGYLGIVSFDGGDEIGWDLDIMDSTSDNPWIDFENKCVKMDDGLECYIMAPMINPTLVYC